MNAAKDTIHSPYIAHSGTAAELGLDPDGIFKVWRLPDGRCLYGTGVPGKSVRIIELPKDFDARVLTMHLPEDNLKTPISAGYYWLVNDRTGSNLSYNVEDSLISAKMYALGVAMNIRPCDISWAEMVHKLKAVHQDMKDRLAMLALSGNLTDTERTDLSW